MDERDYENEWLTCAFQWLLTITGIVAFAFIIFAFVLMSLHG